MLTKIQDQDYIAVNHFLIFGNKLDAYLFAHANTTKSDNIRSLKNMSWQFFKQAHILRLLESEKQRFIDNMPVMLDRIGMKNPIDQNIIKKDKQNDNNIIETDKLDKEQAKKVLVKLINTNKTDAKTVSQAMQLLSKLEQWDKEKPTQNSNITLYELPKKLNT